MTMQDWHRGMKRIVPKKLVSEKEEDEEEDDKVGIAHKPGPTLSPLLKIMNINTKHMTKLRYLAS
jgi:hypothetical protein